jgi:Uma2 family endonuclease
MTLTSGPSLLLPADLRLTTDQFAQVCQANPDTVLELSADGRLITMTPTGGDTGQRNLILGALLWQAVRQCGLPITIFDSSTGFRLPDGSVLSPDASLVLQERWMSLTPEQRRGFPPLCPDVVVELASPSDDGPRGVSALRQKMELYRCNGAKLGWLLLPEDRAVEIWRADSPSPDRLVPADQLTAAPLFPELRLDLREIWHA